MLDIVASWGAGGTTLWGIIEGLIKLAFSQGKWQAGVAATALIGAAVVFFAQVKVFQTYLGAIKTEIDQELKLTDWSQGNIERLRRWTQGYSGAYALLQSALALGATIGTIRSGLGELPVVGEAILFEIGIFDATVVAGVVGATAVQVDVENMFNQQEAILGYHLIMD